RQRRECWRIQYAEAFCTGASLNTAVAQNAGACSALACIYFYVFFLLLLFLLYQPEYLYIRI
ncbi:hypothetical protein O5190_27665, partial [Escherichia coli]|nr:hypothetical protein [Escherichia coli]